MIKTEKTKQSRKTIAVFWPVLDPSGTKVPKNPIKPKKGKKEPIEPDVAPIEILCDILPRPQAPADHLGASGACKPLEILSESRSGPELSGRSI